MKKLILNTLLVGLFISLNLHAFDASSLANNFAGQKAAAALPAKVSMVQSAKKFATDTVASLSATLAQYVNAYSMGASMVVVLSGIIYKNHLQQNNLQNDLRNAACNAL